METTNKFKIERKLVDKKINIKDDVTEYIYEYDIYRNGELVNHRTIKRTNTKKYPNKFNEELHKESVIEQINKYIDENKIEISTLNKRINLDKILKNIVEYIDFYTKIKCTQAQIRTIIQNDILKLK